MTTTPDGPPDPHLDAVLARLGELGWEMWARFDREVRHHRWHSFVPADYDRIRIALEALRRPGMRFLEFGSANGVITVMADLLGYEAYGIEIDEHLVQVARDTAALFGSKATFVAGSFLPEGYVWRPRGGDGRLGTVGEGVSGYLRLGRPLDEFDLVYAYPWSGEEAMMIDLFDTYGAQGSGLLLHRVSGEVQLLRGGKVERSWTSDPAIPRTSPLTPGTGSR